MTPAAESMRRADYLADAYYAHTSNCARCSNTQPACRTGRLLSAHLDAEGYGYARIAALGVGR